MMDQSIDVAVLDAAFFQMSPPAIERPAIDLNADVAEMRRLMAQATARVAERLDAWITDSHRRMEALGAVLSAGTVEPHHLDHLMQAALDIEKDAEEFVIRHQRSEKRTRKLLKRTKAISPLLTRAVEEGLEEAKELAKREIEARLDAALVFRALSSQYTPDNDSGVTITSSSDIDKVLAEAMASV